MLDSNFFTQPLFCDFFKTKHTSCGVIFFRLVFDFTAAINFKIIEQNRNITNCFSSAIN